MLLGYLHIQIPPCQLSIGTFGEITSKAFGWLCVCIALTTFLWQEIDQLYERAANIDGDVTHALSVLVRQQDAGSISASLCSKQQ